MIVRLSTLLVLFLASTSLPSFCHGVPDREEFLQKGRQQHRQLIADAATNPPQVHVDLSKEYEDAPKDHPLAAQMEEIAANSDDNLNAFIALECGRVVAEDYKDGFDET
jgi:hypothetical protein